MTAIIVDTSAILASLDEAYAEHEAIAAIIAGADGLLVVSPMVAAGPRFNRTGLLMRPTSRSRLKFCMLRAPI